MAKNQLTLEFDWVQQLNMKMANQSHKIVTDKYNVNEVNKVILKTMNL